MKNIVTEHLPDTPAETIVSWALIREQMSELILLREKVAEAELGVPVGLRIEGMLDGGTKKATKARFGNHP